MDIETEITEAAVFQYYASSCIERWNKLIGWPIEHRVPDLGTCKLERVKPADGDILLHIRFDRDGQTDNLRKFEGKRFGDFFIVDKLPESLDGIDKVRTELLEKLKREEELRREEERIAREREERKIREEVEKQARLEEERRQREKEAKAKQHFANLRVKYRIEGTKEVEPTSPLFQILLQLENKERLSQDDIKWLEKKNLYKFLAEYFEWRYKNVGDGWDLVKAGKYYRRAKQPEQVLEIYRTVHLDDAQLQSAILTNRGGAYRDLKDWTSAEECAMNALKIQPKSYYPYNLLGAICYQRGEPKAGDVHFQRAVDLGSTPKDQDSYIRKAMDDSEEDTKRLVAQYLLDKDLGL